MNSVFYDVLTLIGSLAGLWFAAGWIVDGATAIAKRFGMSDLAIGLSVVAFGTSAPEFAVSISAALDGASNVAIGNVVGSNIFNLGFILGGVALFAPIPASTKLVRRDGFLLVGASALLFGFLFDSRLARWEGIVMASILVAYVGYLLISKEADPEDVEDAGEVAYKWFSPLVLVGGLALIILSGDFLVDSASGLASRFGMSEWAIAVTVVAAGTSAPELATAFAAAVKGRHGVGAGNLVGSDLFNMLGALGVSAIVNPLDALPESRVSVGLLLVAAVVVVSMIRTSWRVTRAEGVALVIIALARYLSPLV
jgi:cation:H+ antiporter